MLGIAQLINDAWTHESHDDHDVALRLYKVAFNNVLDINNQVHSSSVESIPGISPFEIRSVADYLNHRACHLHFILNHPREAITQFRKYVDTFKQHTKAPEYAFEHSAWLSQQYLMFADLFHQAVASGTKASKVQHPGYYYFEAANQMIERRKNITEYTNDEIRSNQMPVTTELLAMITTSNFTTFLHQCGWVCINPDTGPPVAPGQQAVLSSDQAKIEPINYSEIIIRTLYKALSHFEEWNKFRMATMIGVLIADEYAAKVDPNKAQALYKKSMMAYERDKWTQLVDHLQHKLEVVETPIEKPQ